MHINPLFNATYYQAVHLDLILAGVSTTEQLWQHYVQYGASEDRKPNAWFDADYYLQNNPDLVQAGFSALQALQHFYEYGLYESTRDNTFSRSVKNSDFTAVDYASALSNADLVTAFGIENPEQLTALQTAQLWGHYLSWGYAEGRVGAGPVAQNIKAVQVLHAENRGTFADDEIHWSYAYMHSSGMRFIDGLGGFDTLVLGPRIITGLDEEGIVLTSIEHLVVDGGTQLLTGESGAHFHSLTPLQQLTLSATTTAVGTDLPVQLWLEPTAVSAADDTLQVVVQNTGQHQGVSLVTNGYETVQLQLGAGVQQLGTLQVDQTQGHTFTVQFAGGHSAGLTIGTINNKGSAAVQHLVIDATELKGPLQVAHWGELNNVLNVQVSGSQAFAQGIAALGLNLSSDHNLHWVGGESKDVLGTTVAIDTLHGGLGADVFDVSVAGLSLVRLADANATVRIAAMDTITDFKKGDGLRVDSLQWVAPKTGQAAELTTLEAWVSQLQSAGQAFNFQGDGYVVLRAAEDAALTGLELVKLSGVDMGRFFDAAGQAQWDAQLQAFTWLS